MIMLDDTQMNPPSDMPEQGMEEGTEEEKKEGGEEGSEGSEGGDSAM